MLVIEDEGGDERHLGACIDRGGVTEEKKEREKHNRRAMYL